MSAKDIELWWKKGLELDFYKIDEKINSEIPLELHHHVGNLLSLIKVAIEKLKISLILPKLLENPKVLHQYLQNTKYENSLKLVIDYRKKMIPGSLQGLYQNDYQTIKIVDYFQENHKILDVLPNWLDDISGGEKSFLTAFEEIYQIAEKRFRRSARSDLAKEKRLHEVYLANEEIKQNINETLHRLQNKKLNRLWKDTAKTGVIKSLEDELTFNQYDNNLFLKREMFASHRQIQQDNNAFAAKQQEIEEDLKREQLDYENKLKTDLVKERIIRDERNKLELQLEALLRKCDQTMCDKYTEEILFQEEYERQKQELDNFLIEYKKEEAIYEELVLKKEQEYQSLHEAKVLLFTYCCAVKKIQKWWKNIQTKKTKAAKAKAKRDAAKEKPTGKRDVKKQHKSKPTNKAKKKN